MQKKTGYEWWILAVFFILAYFIGWAGYFEYLSCSEWKNLECTARKVSSSVWLSSAFYSLQMIAFNPPYFNEPIPWKLHLGRWIAAASFLWATGKVIYLVLYRDIQNLKLRWRKDHLVICGLGKLGLPLAMQANEAGNAKPVVIENDGGEENIREASRSGIPVVIGEPTESSTLYRARANNASRVFALCDDDETNIGVAFQLGKLKNRKKTSKKLECIFFLKNTSLRAALQRYSVFPQNNPDFNVNVRALDMHSLRARLAFASLPLDHVSLPENSDKRPRIVIIGFGQMGHSMAIQAALISHFPSGGKLQINVVDEKALKRINSLDHSFPNMRLTADIEKIGGSIESSEVRKRIIELCTVAEKQGELLACVVCHDDDNSRNFIQALDLVRDLKGLKAPILVYLTTKAGYSQLMPTGNEGFRVTDSRLIPFGMAEDIWTYEAIRDEKQDILAKAFHNAYSDIVAQIKVDGVACKPRPATIPWGQLDEFYRQSNRAHADHIHVKLHSIGLMSVQGDDCKEDAISSIDKKSVEILSKMEHRRWCAERWLSGWSSPDATTVLDETKIHADLVPWQNLADKEREIDRAMIRAIPDVLGKIGVSVVKK